MEKPDLLHIIRHGASNPDEANRVLALRDEYPFCQLLQVLGARVSDDHDLPSASVALQLAAVYSSDRHILKELMSFEYPGDEKIEMVVTEPEVPREEVKISEPVIRVEPVKAEGVPLSEEKVIIPQVSNRDQEPQPSPIVTHTTTEKAEAKRTTTAREPEEHDISETVIEDLKKLHQLKHNFEMLFTDYATVSTPTPAVESDDHNKIDEGHKSRKERIKELAKAVSNESSTPAPKRKKKEPDHIIEEIQTTKEEIEPESERQKEQIQIIDHFIKTQPTISNPRERIIPPSTDLNSIKSGEFSDNIISETLVEILIKQGKKDRAIEVLKKLIWKYPQKKAYFASQIEDLKK